MGGGSLPTYGDLLPAAREWARDEIDRAKGRLTLDEEEHVQKDIFARAARRLTLEKFAAATLHNLKTSGKSQAYIDRLDKLLHTFVPADLKFKLMPDITGREIIKVLRSKNLSLGNMRVLRPFLRKIFDDYHRVAFGRHDVENALKRHPINPSPARPGKPLKRWSQEKFAGAFKLLESEEKYWQQAYCLRIFLMCSKAPLTRVMAAKWSDVASITRPKTEGVFGNKRRKYYAWNWKDNVSGRERLDGVSLKEIQKAYHLSQSVIPQTDYVFPSSYGRKSEHIRSIDHVWNNFLHQLNLAYMSPNEFRKIYNERSLRESWYWKYIRWD